MTTSRNDAAAIALEDRLCLALYTASRAMTARYRPLLAALGLTYPQYLVMVALWECGPQPVRALGARLALESSTLSPLLKRLDGLGLILRTRATTDERLVTIALTDAGRALETQASEITLAICDSVGMTLAEQDILVTQLKELTAELARATTTSAR